MAAILSRIGFPKKINTKVYNLNPAVSVFSKKDFDLELEPSHRCTRASYASAIQQLHHRSQKSSCCSHSELVSGRNMHKSDSCEPGSFENQSVTVLANYSVCTAEETTQKINGCLKVAEEMSEGAARILLNLHQQGEQITQTHQSAATFDRVLQRGEKLLGSLGGLFSRRWKPRKSREIKDQILTKDEFFTRKGNIKQKQKLGLNSPRLQSNPSHFHSGSSSVLERIELEKARQDDTLSELSKLLAKLKAMAVDMGSETDRQNKTLVRLEDDVDELNIRMKGANLRIRHLLRR